MFSATHVTFDESEVSKSITGLCIHSLNVHLSVHYLDNAHFLIDAQHCQQTYGCLRSVSSLNILDTTFAVHYGTS